MGGDLGAPLLVVLAVFTASFGLLLILVSMGWLPAVGDNASWLFPGASDDLLGRILVFEGVAFCIVAGRKLVAWNSRRETAALMRFQEKEIAQRKAAGAPPDSA